MNYYDNIGWVNEYVSNVSSYIHVRSYDSLLIKIPNEAYKLNEQGIRVLEHLLCGKSVYEIVDSYPDAEAVARDIHFFFCDLKALLKGCYNEKDSRRSVIKKEFEIPYNTLPVLSEIALTYRCNLKCSFCYASCGCIKNEQTPEMSTKELKDVLKIIRREAEIPSVSFTGGEPTLREDLPEIVSFAKSLKMWTNLITNGTLLTEELVNKLKESGLDSAQVSIEGEEYLHDEIVGSPGAFSKSICGIKNLMKKDIRVHTNTTISKLNRYGLKKILELVKGIGLDKLSMNMLTPQGSALSAFDDMEVSYRDIGGIVLDAFNKSREMGLEFMWYSPTPICIFNPIIHGLGNKGCAACDGLLSISPNGNIIPCSSYFKPMGNILEMGDDFKKRWHGKEFEFFQKKEFAHDICRECEYLVVCNGGCPLYWDIKGYDELKNVQKEAGE